MTSKGGRCDGLAGRKERVGARTEGGRAYPPCDKVTWHTVLLHTTVSAWSPQFQTAALSASALRGHVSINCHKSIVVNVAAMPFFQRHAGGRGACRRLPVHEGTIWVGDKHGRAGIDGRCRGLRFASYEWGGLSKETGLVVYSFQRLVPCRQPVLYRTASNSHVLPPPP